MQDLINSVSNWELVKLVGGIGVVLSAIAIFVSRILNNYALHRWKEKSDRKIEEHKSELHRQVRLLDNLTSIIPNLHIATNERRLDHFGRVWESMLQIKKDFPTLCGIAYTILTKDEIRDLPKDPNPNVGELVRTFEPNQYFTKLSDISHRTESSRPFVGQKAWNVYFVYQSLHGRLTYLISDGFPKGRIGYWLDETAFLEQVVAIAVPKEVQEKLFENPLQAYLNITNYLELELINEISSRFESHLVASDSTKEAIEISRAYGHIRSDKHGSP